MNPSVHTDDARFLELLERWLTGDFTRSDEREMYALTAEDAFRREAWKGFEALPETQHEIQLERLRKRLLPPRGKRFPIGMWMTAAAALLVLLAATYFITSPTANKSAPIAQSSEPEAEQAQSQPTVQPDSLSDLAVLEPANKSEPTTSNEITSRDLGDQESEMSSGGGQDASALRNPDTPSKPGNVPIAAKSKRPANTAPVQTSVADAKDEVAAEKPVAVSTAPQPATVPTSDEYVRAETKENQARKQNAERSLPSKKAESAAAPIDGWDNFHSFLRRTARLPAAARNNNISGKVRLEFTVGPDGKPANVRVVRSLGYGCDEEAMRLIRLFDWSPPSVVPVVVEVPFVR